MSTFKTMIASDTGHEKVYAEIYCDEKFVALVCQEDGLDELIIEFPSQAVDVDMIQRCVSLNGFIDALSEAKKRLAGEIP